MLWASLTSLTPSIPVDRIDVDLPKSGKRTFKKVDELFLKVANINEQAIAASNVHGCANGTDCDKAKMLAYANGIMMETKADDATEKRTIVRVPLARVDDPFDLLVS